MNKSIGIVIICVLGIYAFVVRFAALENREFFNYDEFMYYEGAIHAPFLKDLFMHLPEVAKRKDLILTDLIEVARGLFPAEYQLPTYLLISMILSVFFGIRPETAFYMNATFGIITIWMVFLLARKLFSTKVAFWSAFLMAISPTHIFYSRNGYSISMALCFMLSSLYFYVKSRKEQERMLFNRILSGIFWGLSVTSHPSYLIFLPIYLFFELERYLRCSVRLKDFVLTAAQLLSFAIIFLMWEIPYIIIHTFFALKGQIPFFKDFYTSMIPLNNIGSLIRNLILGVHRYANWYNAQTHSPLDPVYFFYYLTISDGMLFIYAGLISIVLLSYNFIKTKQFESLFILLWAIIPYIAFSQAHVTMHIRQYVSIMPALFIAIGFLLNFLLERKSTRFLSIIFAFIFLIGYGLNAVDKGTKIIKSKLCLIPIAHYIQRHNLDDILVNSVMMGFNVKDNVIRNLPGFKVGLKTYDFSHVSNASIKSARYSTKIVLPRMWLYWTDVKGIYRKGQIRYFITNLLDGDIDFPPKGALKGVKPLVYVNNPHFVYNAGICDSKSYTDARRYLANDSLRYVGLYDLLEVFGK